MDCACYDSTDQLIIGVRGGRVFKCDPTTGLILAQSDYQQLGLGAATIVWDAGTNKCYAACWNTGNYNTTAGTSVRKITRIIPSTLATDLVLDFDTLLGVGGGGSQLEYGVSSLKSVGTEIYGMGWTSTTLATVFRFVAALPAPGTTQHRTFGGDYPSFTYANVGGDDRVYFNSVGGQDVEWWDFTSSTHGNGPNDTKNRLSIEFAPVQGTFFIPEEFQFIDVYDNTGTFVTQINTLRSTFNGVNIQLNPNDGLLYVAGGTDNTVIVVNPATQTFTVITGFDLPWRFVFTPSKRFAVQQGSTPLKAF